MPSGIPARTASAVMIRLPTMALRRPPVAPGGGVISVNTCGESAPTPSQSRAPRMSPSQPRPSAAAATDSPMATALRRRRAAYKTMPSLPPSAFRLPRDAHQQKPRDRQHHEGDEEQHEAERNQRRGVEIADGFRELVGDRGRNRRAGGQERGGDLVGVADHEGEGHRLA